MLGSNFFDGCCAVTLRSHGSKLSLLLS